MALLMKMIMGCSLIASGLAGCRTAASGSQLKEFVRPREDPEMITNLDLKLESVKDIPQKAVKHTAILEEDEEDDDQLVDHVYDYLTISFGKVSKEQFDLLQGTYFKNPLMTYSSEKEYELLDFMPAQIQAVAGTTFKQESREVGKAVDEKGREWVYETDVMTNCWTAAYNIIRGDTSKHEVFMAGSYIESALTDPRYSHQIKKYVVTKKWKKETQTIRNQGLKPFDVILIRGNDGEKYQLAHVAIFIDDDVYFEKTGPEDQNNYRFIRFENIADNFSQWADASIEVRRFDGEQLPPARQTLSMKSRNIGIEEEILFGEFKNKKEWILENSTDYSYTTPEQNRFGFEGRGTAAFGTFVDLPLVFNKKSERYSFKGNILKQKILPPIP